MRKATLEHVKTLLLTKDLTIELLKRLHATGRTTVSRRDLRRIYLQASDNEIQLLISLGYLPKYVKEGTHKAFIIQDVIDTLEGVTDETV